MEELKPCPFCGCEATHEYDSDWGLVVRCTLCGAIMTDTLYPIKQEAITAWNQRAERTCKVEWKHIGDDVVAGYCECGLELDRLRDYEPAHIPKHCPNCNAKLVV